MSYHVGDTICAIASAPGGAARGIVRISGPAALSIVEKCRSEDAGGGSVKQFSNARVMPSYVRIALDEPTTSSRLPCDLYVWPTSRSYTREPVVELHTFGSPPILEAVVTALCKAGARSAEPGEFTLRAFVAGRIDLTQAEAVVGVIDAGGKDELHAALAQLAGGLAGPLNRLRDELLQLLAELEAGLDFVDEDIEFISSGELIERLDSAIELLDGVNRQMNSRHSVAGLPQVVLIGPPNAGKSSLFNALVERFGTNRNERPMQPAALVSAIEGTTRDYLTASISFDGLHVELVDTAGIEPRDRQKINEPTIEDQAQVLATERRSRADVRAYCVDASELPSTDGSLFKQIAQEPLHPDLMILTKSDLAPASMHSQRQASAHRRVAITSSRTGEGLEELGAALREILSGGQSPPVAKGVRATAERCRESIRLAAAALTSAKTISAANGGAELVAEELRTALDELGKVVGAVYTDDLLDRIFSTFCIGK